MVKIPKKHTSFFENDEETFKLLRRNHNITIYQGVLDRSNSAFNLMCTLYGATLFSFTSRNFLFPNLKPFLHLRKFTKEVMHKKYYKHFSVEQQEVFIDVLLFIYKTFSFKNCCRLAEEISHDILCDKKIFLPIRLVVSAKLIEAKIHHKKNLDLDKLDLMYELRHKHIRKNLGNHYRDTLVRVAKLIDDKEVLNAIKVD